MFRCFWERGKCDICHTLKQTNDNKNMEELYFMHNVIWLPAVQNRLSPSSKSLRLKWTGIPRWPIHFKE
ncbi:hypothetical protein OUZ56_014351 [Daphnia magna]|uniref:Uncharacterized protein n=1 Tax=Daphnia magna TaxID=35525 RepID=A0ABR0AJI6_9CRUS|nr:hypothetical protein OUZ56_014351 [Daphnia magna]